MLSRFKVSVSVAEATDVRPVPPTMTNVSPPEIVKLSPLSASTVNEVDIEAVPAAVKRPWASTVKVGIALAEP